MVQKLQENITQTIYDLQVTRRDLKEYNDLRKLLEEIHKRQVSLDKRCIFNNTNPSGSISVLQKKFESDLKNIRDSLLAVKEGSVTKEDFDKSFDGFKDEMIELQTQVKKTTDTLLLSRGEKKQKLRAEEVFFKYAGWVIALVALGLNAYKVFKGG